MVLTKSILDEPIEEINVPVMQPTRKIKMSVTPKRKPAIYVRRSFNKFADWITSYVPEPIKRNVNERVEKLKLEIEEIYSRYDRLTLYEREAPMKGFLKTHRIDGKKGYDQYTTKEKDENVGKIFVENLESDIAEIYASCKSKKNMRITRKEEGDFQKALVCHICENQLKSEIIVI